MNKYAVIFFAFIVIIITAFFIARTSNSITPVAVDNTPTKQEVVVKKYTEADKAKVLTDTSGDYYMGKELAPVVLIEYASLTCPHCKHFHADVVEPLIPTYVETGKVKYVFRDFPLDRHAFEAAKLAHCAGKDRFFSFLKVLFQSQDNWALPGSPEIKKIGAFGGIDSATYDKCMADKDIENKILTGQKIADEVLDVNTTPTIFINGHIYKGAHKFEDVSKFIDAQLKGSE